jgi:endonuclease/exonuclease/phosphatase family metal-dependent hydrolase
VTSTSSGNYATELTLQGVGGPVTIPRGWTSADVTVNRRSFRFINTHLESIHPLIRAAQAAELVAPGGPAAPSVTGPIVLVGDLNSDPNQGPPDSTAYATVVAGGFVDTWTQVNGAAPGLTFGFGELLNDADASRFDQRIDHVLTAPLRAERSVPASPESTRIAGPRPSCGPPTMRE